MYTEEQIAIIREHFKDFGTFTKYYYKREIPQPLEESIFKEGVEATMLHVEYLAQFIVWQFITEQPSTIIHVARTAPLHLHQAVSNAIEQLPRWIAPKILTKQQKLIGTEFGHRIYSCGSDTIEQLRGIKCDWVIFDESSLTSSNADAVWLRFSMVPRKTILLNSAFVDPDTFLGNLVDDLLTR